MSIEFCETTRSFFLQTPRSTYAFCIHPRLMVPIHLHWGGKIAADDRLAQSRIEWGRAFAPQVFPREGNPSLEEVQQEIPTFGSGDFRVPMLEVTQPNGSGVLDLRYTDHRIVAGKPGLPGLPATYVDAPEEAETVEIALRDELTGLEVTLSYTAFRDYDAITRSLRVSNQGPDTQRLERVLSASLDFNHQDFRLLQLSGAWARERFVEISPLHQGTQAVESRRGASSHMHNPFIALLEGGANETHGDVFGFSLVYSGNFLAQVEVNQLAQARVSLGINPFYFGWELLPGESFQAPEVVMVHAEDGLDGMSQTYHRLYRERLCRGKFRDQPRPIVINNWEATYFKFDEAKIVGIARKAAELGVELFVLDDGWFGHRDDGTTSLGDWVVDRRKLPGGVRALAEKVCALGMEFGLWFEPEMVSEDSDLYRAHPDWCLHVPGRRRSLTRDQLVLDLSRSEVCDYIIDAVGSVLADAPITYVKWDMNRSMTEIGSPGLPGHRQREIGHRYMLGLYRVLETLAARFPAVLWEGCSGGGGRFDPGMLHYFPQIWTSDNTDAITRQKIQYGSSLVYPSSSLSAHVSAVPNHVEHRITPLHTRFNVALTGAFGYELDLNLLSEAEQDAVRQQIVDYKGFRSTLFGGMFHRLLSPFEGNETGWMYVAAGGSEVLAFYFRDLVVGHTSWRRLRLRGLEPTARYRCGDDVYAGDLLMQAGLPVPKLEGDFCSTRWHLQRI